MKIESSTISGPPKSGCQFLLWISFATILFLIPSQPVDAKKKDLYQPISFDFLGGYQTMSQYAPRAGRSGRADERSNNTSVPENVLSLNGKKISVQGFMVPLEVPDARVTTFLLVRDKASCCFGGPPKLTHRIYVTMEGDKSAEFFPDDIVTVKGTFKVLGNIIEEDTMALYEMDGESVEEKNKIELNQKGSRK